MNDEFILFSSQNLIKKFHFEDGTTAEKMAQKMPMWSTSVSIYAVLNISIVHVKMLRIYLSSSLKV
jgi:hypothetical protein